jgi:hypothetical protein
MSWSFDRVVKLPIFFPFCLVTKPPSLKGYHDTNLNYQDPLYLVSQKEKLLAFFWDILYVG